MWKQPAMAEPLNEQPRLSFSADTYLRLLRVRDWVKNLVILLPLFFAVRIDELALLAQGLIAVVVFCLVSSSVYIFNDMRDREADRTHPRKKSRPLASGAVAGTSAAAFMVVLLASGLAISATFSPAMLPLVALYFLLNLAYSLKLKYIPIVDIFTISAGFVIRIFVGGIVTQMYISMWIIIMTFLLTMFMGLAKRRDDVVICIETGVEVRTVVAAYNLRFIDTALSIMAAVTIVAYIMYTVSPDIVAKFHTDKLYLTTAFVVVGILRYLQMIFVEKKGGSPTEILLTDTFMQICVAGWLVVFGLLIYTAR
jgi:decaprenyl-phosphate phosphoribosyltransferase